MGSIYELELKNICKNFGALKANHNIQLQVKKGEVHAIVGENGAGKTTLMNILYGLYQPDAGEIYFKGEPVRFSNPSDAIEKGIGMVHQHFMLSPSLTVAENIALGKPPKGKLLWKQSDLKEKIQPILDSTHLKIDLDAKVSDISVGQMQRVEIIKTLYRGAAFIILDEPTATLTPNEAEELFQIMRNLTEQGYTILFITHKIHEVMRVADRVTALRLGEYVGTEDIASVGPKDITHMMIGRDMAGIKRDNQHGKNVGKQPVLSLKDVHVMENNVKEAVSGVTFDVFPGEILGVAGVEGNGQSELSEAIIGTRKVSSGSILIKNQDVTKLSTKERLNMSMGYVPPNRMREGLALDLSVCENLVAGIHDKEPIAKKGFMKWKKAYERGDELIEKFAIKTQDKKERARNLSGGNLQKIVIGRELGREPDLVVASQPTRGIDIGSTEQIHQVFIDLRNNDGAVLLVSSDLDELMEVSDRIMVMFEGKITGVLNADEFSRKRLGGLMFGRTEVDEDEANKAAE